MPDFDLILWDDEDDLDGNVWHIRLNGLTPDEVEDALSGPGVRDVSSRSTGRSSSYASLLNGRSLFIVYELSKEAGLVFLYPITAYELLQD
ncbi:hypothetical protein EP7_001670 [Isosphaeraceae bacterium EP7]